MAVVAGRVASRRVGQGPVAGLHARARVSRVAGVRVGRRRASVVGRRVITAVLRVAVALTRAGRRRPRAPGSYLVWATWG